MDPSSEPLATEPATVALVQSQDGEGVKHKKVKFAWGSLVSLNQEYPHQELFADSYLLGRHKDCDIKFKSESVSNRHCRIFKEVQDDSQKPVVFIEDLSSNGTFVNGKKIGKGNKMLLGHKDEIQLTTKKEADNPNAGIYYLFHLPHQKGKERGREEASGGEKSDLPARNISDHYEIQRVIGSGNFADVKLGIDKTTGEKFAIKVIDKTKNWTNPKFFEALQREVQIMMEVQHPNLVSIVDYYDEEKTLYLVLEFMQGGDLFDRLIEKKKFSEAEAKLVFMQLLLGVKYLHHADIAHRDLKPENVLLVDTSNDFPVKITDFGLARIVNEGSFMKTHNGGMSGYNKAVDLWSLGVILYILLCGYPAFSDERKDHKLKDQIEKAIYSFHSPYWDPISDNAKNLIRGLLTVDPNVRLTVDEALKHPWMTVDPPVLKDVHKRLSKRGAGLPAVAMKRTDMVMPLEISSPSFGNGPAAQEAKGKRERPPKDATDSLTPADKKPRFEENDAGEAKTSPKKETKRRGGPGRGKKGPKTDTAEREEDEDESVAKDANGQGETESQSQTAEVPARGRQGTKFVKPAAKKESAPASSAATATETVVGTRRSARTRKTE